MWSFIFNIFLLKPTTLSALRTLLLCTVSVYHDPSYKTERLFSIITNPQSSHILQTVSSRSSLTLVCFCSLMRYTPNPGGGGRARAAAPGKGRSTSCSLCSNAGLPIVDEICPFHQHQTEGLVCRSAVLSSFSYHLTFLVRSVCYAVHVCVCCRPIVERFFVHSRQPCSVDVVACETTQPALSCRLRYE